MKSIAENLHIMLADDDPDDAFLFREALGELTGTATVELAPNGHELMKMLAENSRRTPDFLFLDLNMPVRNGFECLSDLRQSRDRFRSTRVVVLTTSNLKSSMDKVFGLGALCYVVKPSSYTGLKSAIAKVLLTDWSPASGQSGPKKLILW